MRVIAKERGYYGGLREPGDEFEITGKEALGEWMEPIKEAPKPKGNKASDANKADTSTKDADDNLPDA